MCRGKKTLLNWKKKGGGVIGLVSGGTEYPQCYREMPYFSKPTPSHQFCP